MAELKPKFKTFINPEGIVEQHYIGVQTPESVLAALRDLEKCAKKAARSPRKTLILADVSRLPKIDLSARMFSARKAGLQTMRRINFDRAAVYGPLKVQLLVNTMALITGKQQKLRVFSDRVEAIKWLKEKN